MESENVVQPSVNGTAEAVGTHASKEGDILSKSNETLEVPVTTDDEKTNQETLILKPKTLAELMDELLTQGLASVCF